jgi:tetratricopeptide (TPR) repeat protein
MITSKGGFEFAQRCVKVLHPNYVDTPTLEEVKHEEPIVKEPVDGPAKILGSTDYAKWENFEDEEDKEESAEEMAKKFAGGCSQDHRKEREIYERPTAEKLQAALLFKEQGNKAVSEQSYSLAAVHYRKGMLQLDYSFPDTEKEKADFYSMKTILHNNMGLVKYHLEEYDEALNHLDQVLKIDKVNQKAMVRKAQIFLTRDLFDKT